MSLVVPTQKNQRTMTTFSTRLITPSVLAGLALGSLTFFISGCAQNAALEITIDLPSAPDDGTPVFVLIQPRTAADHSFDVVWGGHDLDAIQLVQDDFSTDHISVLSTDATADLNLKLRFCTSPDCTAIADASAPERWYTLLHPFYIGERTAWETEILDLPTVSDTVPEVVGRCDIQGCVDGPLSSYCRADDRHLCE